MCAIEAMVFSRLKANYASGSLSMTERNDWYTQNQQHEEIWTEQGNRLKQRRQIYSIVLVSRMDCLRFQTDLNIRGVYIE